MPNSVYFGQIPWFLKANTIQAIQGGAMYKYVRNPAVYHCSADYTWHLVSYGMNSNLNGEKFGNPMPLGKRTQVKRHSEMMVLTDENDYRDPGGGTGDYGASAVNIGSFGQNATGDTFIDPPGTWHNKGAILVFADGHAEHWRWADQRTLALRGFGQSSPNNPDLKRLQEALFDLKPGVMP
jgi:prepilin-type processing-associated H-X9-DG protein